MRRAALYAPAPTPAVLVCAGDSITAGYGVATGQSWGEQMSARLRTMGLRATFYNAGHSGDTSADLLSREAAEVVARYSAAGRFVRGHACPAIAVIEICTNDIAAGGDPGDSNANLDDAVAAAQAPGFAVGVVTVLRRTGTFSGGADADSFELARGYINDYIRFTLACDFVIDPAEDERLSDPDDPTYWQTATYPGVHPNEAGAAVMAEYGAASAAAYVVGT